MFNQDIKEKFIEDYTKDKKSNTTIRSYFNSLSKVEEKNNQDIYSIPYDTIADDILALIKINTYYSYWQYMNIVKHYKDWCLLNNMLSNGSVIAFDGVSNNSLKEKYAHHIGLIIFRNFSELHQYIDGILFSENNSENMLRVDFFKLVILLLYQGIPEETIYTLTTQDIKIMDNGIFIIYNNRLKQIEDKELEELLKKRCSTQYYQMDKGSRFDYVLLSDYLIDFGAANPDKTKTNIKEGISRLTSNYNKEHNTNKKIEYYNVYAYGIVREIKLKEELEQRKFKKKEIYEYFAQNNNNKDIESAGKKRLINAIYQSW